MNGKPFQGNMQSVYLYVGREILEIQEAYWK